MHFSHACKFTEQSEKNIQEITKRRNIAFGYNNRDEDSPNRWIGLCGELTLNDWFKKSPYVEHAHSHFKAMVKDDTDFDLGRLNIDVKIQGKSNEPNDFDFFYVYESQYERIMEKNITNILCFGFYEFPSKTCSIAGFITLSDFDKFCAFYQKGESRFKNGKYPLSTNDYAIMAKKAYSEGIIHPLIDFGRYI